MFQLDLGEILEHIEPVFVELADEARDVEIGVHSVAQREVVSLGQDFDSVGERALPTHSFLESCTCCSSTIDFSVEETDVN